MINPILRQVVLSVTEEDFAAFVRAATAVNDTTELDLMELALCLSADKIRAREALERYDEFSPPYRPRPFGL